MAAPDIRKGMPPVKLSREEFESVTAAAMSIRVFKPLQRELDAIVAAAWDAYSHSRKAPLTRKAGPGFADPDLRDFGRLAGGARGHPRGAAPP